MKFPIYLDYNATTPVDPRVLEEMLPYFSEVFANAASIDHAPGVAAQQAVEQGRVRIARLIGAAEEEIIFTSGATEANNLALLGVVEKTREQRPHVVTAATEHKAVLDPAGSLARRGADVSILPVDGQGIVDPDELKTALRPNTVLVSIMAANNETGVLQPIEEIGHICLEAGVTFHTDAVQAAGRIEIGVDRVNADLVSLSAHKLYGPKGIGALYVRRRGRRVRVAPVLHGGGHERGLRSGTLNVPAIVGFGVAAELAHAGWRSEGERLRRLREQLWSSLTDDIAGIELNGHPSARLPNTLSVFLPGIENRALLRKVREQLAIAPGSACTTATVEASHVLLAQGYTAARAHQSVRISLGRPTTDAEVEQAGEILVQAAMTLRRLVAAAPF